MRLSKTVNKSNTTYFIIRDYTSLNGKRTTCVYETLGNKQSLIERFGSIDTMDKVKEYINSLNKMIKDNKELPINLVLDPNKRIEKDLERAFFSGHLFLRKIYYELELDKICQNIKSKYKISWCLRYI